MIKCHTFLIALSPFSPVTPNKMFSYTKLTADLDICQGLQYMLSPLCLIKHSKRKKLVHFREKDVLQYLASLSSCNYIDGTGTSLHSTVYIRKEIFALVRYSCNPPLSIQYTNEESDLCTLDTVHCVQSSA